MKYYLLLHIPHFCKLLIYLVYFANYFLLKYFFPFSSTLYSLLQAKVVSQSLPHFILSRAMVVHRLTPIVLRFFSNLFNHMVEGLPRRLLTHIFEKVIFFLVGKIYPSIYKCVPTILMVFCMLNIW